MFEVQVDSSRNRLLVILKGVIAESEADHVVSAVVSNVAQLRPGFDVISDISGLTAGHVAAGLVLQNTIEFLQGNGARNIIRIVGDATVGRAQFDRVSKLVQGYKPVHVRTMAEAEQVLARIAAEAKKKENLEAPGSR